MAEHAIRMILALTVSVPWTSRETGVRSRSLTTARHIPVYTAGLVCPMIQISTAHALEATLDRGVKVCTMYLLP